MSFNNVMRKSIVLSIFICVHSSLFVGCTDSVPSEPEVPLNTWLSKFESPFLTMAPDEKQPILNLRRWLFDFPLLRVDADTEPTLVPSLCRFRNYAALKGGSYKDLTQQYLADCEAAISTGPKDFVQNVHRTMFVPFPLKSHPFIRRIIVNLPNGYKLPGLLALKDDQYKRPWVVVRAGMFGTGFDLQAERFIMIQLFEQAHFNVLFLDSSSSDETIEVNPRVSIGGLDEGIQNFQVGQQLLDPSEPLHRLVSEVHLLAISLGGHGLLMSMILNEVNPTVFQSAVGLCPLIDFHETFRGLGGGNPATIAAMNVYASLRMRSLMGRVPELGRTTFLPQAMDWVRQNFQSPLTLTPELKFPNKFPYDDFEKGNDLLPWIATIKHPVSIIASTQDTLVPFSTNTGLLQKRIKELPFLRIYPLKETFHCTLPGAYSWNEMSEVLRAQFHFANRTGEIPTGFKKVYWPIPNLKAKEALADEIKFELKPGDEFLVAKLKTESNSELWVQIPVDALAWQTTQKVRTETEARVLLRWAQVNVRTAVDKNMNLRLSWAVPEAFKF